MLTRVQITADEALSILESRTKMYEANPGEIANRFRMAAAQYAITKYVRADNTPKNAEYLGYISANELFPDFQYKSFADFVDELIAGGIKRPYPHVKV